MTENSQGRFAFDAFVLDPSDRQLSRGGEPVELNARYLDALALLVRERGKLVTKDRFLEEVWRGVPVTDEALTQCIRTLRRQLGDDAAAPRFIETVPSMATASLLPSNRSAKTLRRCHRRSRQRRGDSSSFWAWPGPPAAASPASLEGCSTALPGPRSRFSRGWARLPC
jgi:hypothetical protein